MEDGAALTDLFHTDRMKDVLLYISPMCEKFLHNKSTLSFQLVRAFEYLYTQYIMVVLTFQIHSV